MLRQVPRGRAHLLHGGYAVRTRRLLRPTFEVVDGDRVVLLLELLLELWISDNDEAPGLLVAAARSADGGVEDRVEYVVRERVRFQPAHRARAPNGLDDVQMNFSRSRCGCLLEYR